MKENRRHFDLKGKGVVFVMTYWRVQALCDDQWPRKERMEKVFEKA